MKLSHTHILRNVVEVCAIVIAGAWAFYVFAYQNVIQPSFATPTPTFTVQMRHVGNDGPLAVVRIDETIRNIGTAPIYFLGHSITVLGMNVSLRTPGADPTPSPGTVYEYSRFTGSKVIYRYVILTQQGDPNRTEGMFVEPGQQVAFSREFYVPKARFGRLVAWVVAGYTKQTRTISTTIRTSRSGVTGFQWSGNDEDVFQLSEQAAELDLKAE